jgi:hypothetical protein
MITGAETAHIGARPPPVIMLEGRLPMLEAVAAKNLGLTEGQVVRPAVETRAGQLMLMVGGQAVNLPPEWRAIAAQNPWWRVHFDAARGGWTFRPLLNEGHAQAQSSPGVMPTHLQQLALRPPHMSALMQLLTPGVLSALAQAAPQIEIRPLLQQLQLLLPSMSRLSPEQLRQWVQYSGWMGEALLAKGKLDKPDLKQILRALLQAWTQAPTSTKVLLQEAVDDIEARQLQASEANPNRDGWVHLMLAFADFDPVDIRYYAPKKRLGEEGVPLVVHLHTRSQTHGELWLQTRISHQTQVDLVMWAAQETVAADARARAAALQEWLESSGLQVTGMQVIHGVRPALPEAQGPTEPGQLLDLKA